MNSERAIVRIVNGKAERGYRVGDLGAPSSCKFGKGDRFRTDYLYITELGRKGRSLKTKGRGIWVLPIIK